ncbi:MAG TPA: hemolysin III family protein [Gemmatimonadaceae bacterium]|nr:hemolysin III family protein [Gemmatimonadaceae bacterium]
MTDMRPSVPRPVRYERPQTPPEEIANSVSHGLGLIAAIVSTPLLLTTAARFGTTRNVVGAAVFAATAILLYAASTIYHAIPHSPVKKLFRTIDHGAIFLLIAGTYTPFTLGVLRGGWGWSLLGIVWSLAILGVALKAIDVLHHPVASTALYIGMGWLAIVAVRPLWLNVPVPGMILMLAGGIAYTGGVAFYTNQRLRYSHLLWHICVLAGTVCHYLAVLWYALPPASRV